MEKCMTYPKSEGYISAKDMAGRAAYYKVLQAAKNGKLTRIKRGVGRCRGSCRGRWQDRGSPPG